jgi:hypothetical protein
MTNERKDERDARQEQRQGERDERQEQRQDAAATPPPGMPMYPVPPVPPGDFTSVQQIIIPEAEIRGTVPQGRHCTGTDPGGTNSLSYTGIDFTQPNALCVVFHIPADIPVNAKGVLHLYEYINDPSKRWGSISLTPFDWAGLPNFPQSVFKSNIGPTFHLQVGLKAPVPGSSVIGIEAGKTYYLNASNHDPLVPKSHGEGWDDLRNVGVEMSSIHLY